MHAPGRLNLVGEHVDHQGGLVLPLALREGVAVAWGPRADRSVRITALDERGADRFTLGSYSRSGRRWLDLARGACATLEARGTRLAGVDLVVAGDLPRRRGLASSAAYLVAIARALLAAAGRAPPTPAALAAAIPEIEETWAGARTGAMDPYVAALGQPGKPALIDCRDLTHEMLPWPEGIAATWRETGVERELSGTPYNDRRAELEAGLWIARAKAPGIRTLRDLSPSRWAEIEALVEEPARRRIRHVVTEIDRVRRAAQALRDGDVAMLGALVNESHASLSRDFECSTPEIDALVARVQAEPGVLGARLQGAGWGGCLLVVHKQRPAPRTRGPEDAPEIDLDSLPSVDEADDDAG